MRAFEIIFFRSNRLVSRTLYQGLRRGDACSFARMLLSVRAADAFQIEEI